MTPAHSPQKPKTIYLLDGPLMLAPERRLATVLNMGDLLLKGDAFRDRRDAFTVLRNAGYDTVEVAMLVEDAMHQAAQALVAAEMMEP